MPFCMNCGKEIANEKFCPNCGVKMPADAQFCAECGTRF